MGYHIYFIGTLKTNLAIKEETYKYLLENDIINKDYAWNFEKDMQTLVFQDCEKFGDYESWILELIEALKIYGYTISGKIKFQGEEVGDVGVIDVTPEKVNISCVDLDNLEFVTKTIY
jgi:hypothetical protein